MSVPQIFVAGVLKCKDSVSTAACAGITGMCFFILIDLLLLHCVAKLDLRWRYKDPLRVGRRPFEGKDKGEEKDSMKH